MKKGMISLGLSGLLLMPSISRADFQYTENTKITGGATAGLLKFASKMGAANGPTVSTKYVKGNRMRVDSGNGRAQIIDLDGHRIIVIDQKQKTYSIMTFDQMRAQMEKVQQERAQMRSNGQLNFSSKTQVTPTQNTKIILGQNTHEVQATVDMQPSDDAGSSAASSGAMSYSSDMWVAPGVSGYQEIRNFYQRLAKDAKWAANVGGSPDPRMAQAMEEMQKNSSALNGFPLLQTVRLTMTGSDGAASHASATHSTDIPNVTVPSSKSDAVGQAMGGLLGFARHKKEQQAEAKNTANSTSSDDNSNSLMAATIEVTSFSGSSLDSSLFDIPAGYSQVQPPSHDAPPAHSR